MSKIRLAQLEFSVIMLRMKNMPSVGIVTSLVLVGIGVIGYFVGGRASVTALIPAFFGVPLLLSSALALKPSRLKMGMHIAAMFGLLGFVMPAGMLASKAAKGTLEWKLSTYSMLSMSIVSLIFVVLCVKSFIDVRRARQ